MAKPDPIAYTVPEAAALLGISEESVYEAIRRNEFPHVKIGRLIRIPKRRFEAWVNGGVAEEERPRVPSGY